MKIACVVSAVSGKVDDLFTEIADRLQATGLTLAGIVRDSNYVCSAENGCDMSVRVLPDGPLIKITQDLGAGSGACRLDPGAIAHAVACVEAGALLGADLFILNKFGPEEAAGRGFCSVIGAALERGIPVLVGVGASGKAAFDSFSDGFATELAAQPDAILAWVQGGAAQAAETNI